MNLAVIACYLQRFKDILQKETAVNFLKGKEFYENSKKS